MVVPSAPVVATPEPFADIAEPDNDLWHFALAFYGRQDVSSACLVLQDQLGVDVDILLFAIFAGVERRVTLHTQDLAALDGLDQRSLAARAQPLPPIPTPPNPG